MLEFLSTRRSVLARELATPGPSETELSRLLEIAARVPDHGRLEPWRFIILTGEDRMVAGERLARIAASREPEIGPARLEAERTRFGHAPVVVCVVSRAGAHPKIPEWEQVLSAGAVCQTLLIAAGAMGYGAQWITGWCAYDPEALDVLGVGEGERVAGFVHIGTAGERPADRPRPRLDTIVTRWQPEGGGAAGEG